MTNKGLQCLLFLPRIGRKMEKFGDHFYFQKWAFGQKKWALTGFELAIGGNLWEKIDFWSLLPTFCPLSAHFYEMKVATKNG